MRKKLHKKVLAGLMSFALAVPSVSISTMAGVQTVFAAENDVLDKVLGAEDITLRVKWNDKSNIGTGHSVTMSDGSTITVKDNGTMRKELTASQLANTEMGIGINLGNTLEARQPVDKKASLGKTDFDLAWGQPVTTREYIDFLHSYGINTLRIPVSWSNGYLDDGSYTIRGIMLDRVEEVANYALDNGMYVIINEHWDNQWFGQSGACKKDADGNKIADEETRKAAWERYEKYWTQISERFKNYSDHLIFEGANEELGTRLNDAICLNGPAKGYAKPDDAGDDIEVLGGNLTTDELYKTANEINQKFVDIVRKTAKKLNASAAVKDSNGTGYTVKTIGKKAFAGAKAEEITLNKNIKNIPSLAFQNCKKLNTLTLKAKLTKAAKDSFKGCKNTILVKGTSSKANKKLLKKTSYNNFK